MGSLRVDGHGASVDQNEDGWLPNCENLGCELVLNGRQVDGRPIVSLELKISE